MSDITDAEPLGGESEQVLSVAGLAHALQEVASPQQERRLIFAKGENMRHVRHAQLLERWPLLPELWARRVDAARLAAVDRTPGAATFGR